MSNEYTISKQNKVRQVSRKAAYDTETVHRILDSALLASVSFVQDGQPVVVPMLYGRDGETIFLHGARKSRIIKLLKSTATVCMNVTHVDGLVYARSAFHSSMHYRSATVFGAARLIEDWDEKVRALRRISECTMPGRWQELRAPLDTEIKMTGIIALQIESASAKVSTGMPDDEEEDYAIPIWAGVLPLQSTFGTAQSDDRLLNNVQPSDAIRKMQGKTL